MKSKKHWHICVHIYTGQGTQDLCMPSNLMAKVFHFYPDRQEGQTQETFRWVL